MKVRPGDVVRIRELYSVDDRSIPVPDAARLTHLQFSRFAGCPICNLHLQSMVDHHGEIVAAGVRQVVLFHSTPDEAGTYARDLPFDVVADPDKELRGIRSGNVVAGCARSARDGTSGQRTFSACRDGAGASLDPRPDPPHRGPPGASGGHTVRPRRGGSRL
jgi:AhpC/TSA family